MNIYNMYMNNMYMYNMYVCACIYSQCKSIA